MEGVLDERAYECARRCLAAMDGHDDDTRQALARAAGRFALRALGMDRTETKGQDAPALRVGGKSPR